MKKSVPSKYGKWAVIGITEWNAGYRAVSGSDGRLQGGDWKGRQPPPEEGSARRPETGLLPTKVLRSDELGMTRTELKSYLSKMSKCADLHQRSQPPIINEQRRGA